jgi:hypothetical protein
VFVLSILLAFTAGCTGGGSGPSTGTALHAEGPPAMGVIGYPNAKVGEVYRFSFPLMRNKSKESVSVTQVKVVSVPTGVKVLSYLVYSVKDTPGYQPSSQDSDHTDGPDMDKYPNCAGHPFTIKPGALSDKYAMVKIRTTGKVSKHIKNCEVDHEQGGQAYRQVLNCEFALDMKEPAM